MADYSVKFIYYAYGQVMGDIITVSQPDDLPIKMGGIQIAIENRMHDILPSPPEVDK